MKRWLILLVIAALSGLIYFLWRTAGAADAGTAASLVPLLAEEDTAGYTQATVPGAVEFPRDLGPHDDYQTEWWYYTGNLEAAAGRPFGFQLTFFRRALAPPAAGPENDGTASSGWRSNQVYLAHFTISDIEGDAFYPAERFSRGAAGLAGAQAEPYRVWLENWLAEQLAPRVVALRAETDQVALDLTLTETLPPILHGDGGLSPKGPEPGNASYYYSIVQQAAAGSVTIAGERFEVIGLAWKDHEYSTSALSPGAVGWDWFSLQMDDGSALMFFQIRREDGSLEPASSGTFIYPDGRTQHLARDQWQLEVLDSWTSPTSGATYPAGWRITIPAVGLELTGRPLMADQELNVSTVYWEGAVSFSGEIDGRPVTARGYIEMTGYAEAMTGRL
jgi:predicted secreted hydrolase